MIEMAGIKTIAAALGGTMSAMLAVFAVGLQDHGLVETITAGGLGAGMSIILVKWLLNQYNTAIGRLSKLEDERASIIRETVGALTRVTDEIAELVDASRKRGEETMKLAEELRHRPCMYQSWTQQQQSHGPQPQKMK